MAPVQYKSGVSTSATTNPAFDTAPTSGNLIVLSFSADDVNNTPDSGWTQSTGLEQVNNIESCLWWRISNGSNPPGSYTIGSASNSSWVLAEFSGIDATPYDVSDGQQSVPGASTTSATPSIVPTTGDRLIVGAVGGGTGSEAADVVSSWSNGFSVVDSIKGPIISQVIISGMGYREVTGDNSTGYSTTATFTIAQIAITGEIISFKKGAAPPEGIFARPGADDTDGGWTDSSAGTNLYAQLDETSASDADYIRSADDPSADTCKIHLGDPGVSYNHADKSAGALCEGWDWDDQSHGEAVRGNNGTVGQDVQRHFGQFCHRERIGHYAQSANLR